MSFISDYFFCQKSTDVVESKILKWQIEKLETKESIQEEVNDSEEGKCLCKSSYGSVRLGFLSVVYTVVAPISKTVPDTEGWTDECQLK